MDEEWREMMAYAPHIEEEFDTDYSKAEDFTELEHKPGEEAEKTVSCESEDYFGVLEENDALVSDGGAYDDYQLLSEFSMDD
jgi:hypothetical protein